MSAFRVERTGAHCIGRVVTADPVEAEEAWLRFLSEWIADRVRGAITVWSDDTAVVPLGHCDLGGRGAAHACEGQPGRQAAQWGPGSPTPAMVAAVGRVAGLSGADAARLLGVSDGRTWRRWLAGDRQMPAATYQWLLTTTGLHPDYGPRAARRRR